MPSIHVNGIDLFYDVQGTGEPLLLIAGFDCDSSYWSAVMPALINKYQVIRVDNRGVGQSSAPDYPYSIQQMADDAAALLNYLGITIHVAGHSMGGQIAQELALAHPEKVKTLTLLSSWGKGNAKFYSLIELFGDLPKKLDVKFYQKILLPWMFTSEFYSSTGAIEQIINFIEEYPYLPTPHGLYHQSRAILKSDTSKNLINICCPTLVVVGKEDILTPVELSQQLAGGIPNAELVILERGGHGFLVESPDAVVEVMLNFLAKHSYPY
ncbi:MAG: alpha/beta hydrolase [Stigonema ocellatum SAG 48.90 = DSM 106950]|nr:alpha/beta hydrolase [Stigonema ocellatum SAG 48.90 = DSM 106950]